MPAMLERRFQILCKPGAPAQSTSVSKEGTQAPDVKTERTSYHPSYPHKVKSVEKPSSSGPGSGKPTGRRDRRQSSTQ